jgi:hypothetical protein
MARKHHHHQKRGGGSTWAYPNNRPVSDDDAAEALANKHPKSNTPPVHDAQVLSGSPGSGEAPGANGPPTTGASGDDGPL